MARTHQDMCRPCRFSLRPCPSAAVSAWCWLWGPQVMLDPKKQEGQWVLRQRPGLSSAAWQAARRKEAFLES